MENLKNIAPLADFDWDAFENGSVAGEAKETLVAAYDQTLNNVHEHEVAEGEVTNITKREVVVRIGSKSDGIIPVSEFRYNPDLKIGDTVEVYVESLEDKKGQLVLSHQGFHQVPHQGWYDRRRIRSRSVPPRFTNRREAHPRLRCIRW